MLISCNGDTFLVVRPVSASVSLHSALRIGKIMPDLQPLLETLRHAYATWGYPIVFFGALLENTVLLGLVLPGGTLVLLGAIYAQQGDMMLPFVLLLGWLGMAAGTSIDYVLGRWGVWSLLHRSQRFQQLEPRLVAAER